MFKLLYSNQNLILLNRNEFWQGFFNDFVVVFENGAKAPPVLLINLILGGMSLSVCPYFACLLGERNQ